MSISKAIPDNIKRACRSIGYAAWLGDSGGWLGLVAVLRVRLTTEQRAALAFATLRSLDYDTACLTADAVLCQDIDERPLDLLEAA